MDVFDVRERLISDYRSFTGAFVEPLDEGIRAFIDEQLAEGAQWPDPWLSLNPNFASGGSVTDLVKADVLHPECEQIFRIKKDPKDPGTRSITFHRHQRDAIEAAASGLCYVLTTGTGSGKSLGYIVPIVDRVIRAKNTNGDPGVKAIIVYPMNALANSQVFELEKFLRYGYSEGDQPVSFDRYTGQESPEDRRRILADPPDILLTNYVMLDLVLTRPDERRHLIAAARGLQFLVLDELHTYRGRQGADVAMLVRRVRDVCEAPNRLLRGASEVLLGLPGVRPSTRTRLRRLRQALIEVTGLAPGMPLPTWSPSRLNERYHVALSLAEIILHGNAVDQEPGEVRIDGFLVNMYKVYEDFLTVALTEAFRTHGGWCRAQDKHHLDVDRRIALEPDLVWYRNGDPGAVIDAKYKAEKPAGFPNADCYQMLAYCTALRLPEGHLIYAKGNASEVVHEVRYAGVTVHAHTIDLDTTPQDLLTQIDTLALQMAAAGMSDATHSVLTGADMA